MTKAAIRMPGLWCGRFDKAFPDFGAAYALPFEIVSYEKPKPATVETKIWLGEKCVYEKGFYILYILSRLPRPSMRHYPALSQLSAVG